MSEPAALSRGVASRQAKFGSFAAALKSGHGLEEWEILILAAHPDDETVGAAAVIWQAERLTLAHVTDGCPASLADARAAGCETSAQYAELRQAELADALGHAGKARIRRARLGFVDQRCAHGLCDLTEAILQLIEECSPNVLITHAYEGGHPDHDATAFAAHQALKRLPGWRMPLLVEMACYHSGSGEIQCGQFLPGPDCEELELQFDAGQRLLKQAMLKCFRSQLGAFHYIATHGERYRPAPNYDFSLPPHPGALHYEKSSLGVKGAEWRELAAAAAQARA
jgi:LmbE family N-acetylglucosaminyl deacetylase